MIESCCGSMTRDEAQTKSAARTAISEAMVNGTLTRRAPSMRRRHANAIQRHRTVIAGA
jgi:hypothetical protein